MFDIRKDFNCCKTVSCKNFGVENSEDYVYQSKRLGYLSIECKAYGSNPPWINNQLIENILKEKLDFHFARKITHCRHCYSHFFFNEKNRSQLHGFTVAGTQRLKCKNCQHVYSETKHKNVEAITQVLQTIIDKLDINSAIRKTGLSARLYYFYLEKLSLLLTNFSRLKEQEEINRDSLSLQTEGKVVHLNHKRGFYTLLTAEADSGYILLQTTNLTKVELLEQDIYNSTESTVIKDAFANNIESEIKNHYQQTLHRKHFEKLLIGELKAINHCNLIYPNKLVYVHFSLLRGFIKKAQHYSHYIELESSIRAAALMSAHPEIKAGKADIFYYLPFLNNQEIIKNRKVGWWSDRWHSFDKGAYSLLTDNKQNQYPFKMTDTEQLNRYYDYLDTHLNKSLNSFNTITNLSEIHRVLFNFCYAQDDKSTAMQFGVANHIYDEMSLLSEAMTYKEYTGE
ncbi:hypothetical protein [Psychromonas sp. KJ10-2]|uniref:hypothetical protein n=1 Tax=Psychromonas sp. KJ10-2 TaxID=3391822 RepID=UPI0039B3CEEE